MDDISGSTPTGNTSPSGGPMGGGRLGERRGVSRSSLRNVSGDRRRLAVLRRTNRARQRITLLVIGLALLVVAGILAAGYVVAFVLPPRQVVVRVNDVSYSRGDLVKSLRVRQEGARFFQIDFQPSQEIFDALRLFVEDEILTQVAAKYGIVVDDGEIDRQIESLFLIGDPGLDPESFRRNLDERYRDYLNSVRLSAEEHREITRRSIQRAKFREFVGEQVSRVAEQVHYYRIVMAVGSEADIMRVTVLDGLAEATTPEQREAVWKSAVRQFSSDDSETIRVGGDRGWMPIGSIDTYAETILNLEVGVMSEPITDVDNPKLILFFMVSERDPARELSDADLESIKSQALQEWVNTERDNHEVMAAFDSDIYTWLLLQLQQTAVPTATPTGPFGDGAPGF